MTRWPTHERVVRCIYCGEQHELASGINGAQPPNDGDATFCIRCGEIGIFDCTTDSGMRRPNRKEARMLLRDLDMQKLRMAWAYAMTQKGHA